MISTYEAEYCQLISKIIHEGQYKEGRNGGTFSLFGEMLKINLLEFGQFPLLHGRKLFYQGVLGEFAAFMRGPKTVNDFKKFGCNYWDAWGNDNNNITVDYGNSWLNYNGINQIKEVINTLRHDKNSRRMVISGWRPDKIQELSLPCCHMTYQWRHNPDSNSLDMLFFMRSVDVMIGLPSDVILAAIWNILMAKEARMNPGTITMMFGDTHIYDNHYAPTMEYLVNCEDLAKNTKDSSFDIATPYHLNEFNSIYEFEPAHFELLAYNPKPAIKFELNV